MLTGKQKRYLRSLAHNIDCCQLLKVCNEGEYKDRFTIQDFRQLSSLGLPVLTSVFEMGTGVSS